MESAEQLRRRMETRRDTKPKGLSDVMTPLGTAQFQNQQQDKLQMDEFLYARCKRLSGRVQLVGSTPFEFDKDGLCKAKIMPGRPTISDFKVLLMMNGVSQEKPGAESMGDVPEPVQPAVGAPSAPVAKEAVSKESGDDSSSSDDEKPKKSQLRRRLAKRKNKDEENN